MYYTYFLTKRKKITDSSMLCFKIIQKVFAIQNIDKKNYFNKK